MTVESTFKNIYFTVLPAVGLHTQMYYLSNAYQKTVCYFYMFFLSTDNKNPRFFFEILFLIVKINILL